MEGPYAIKNITTAKHSPVLAYTRESFASPTDLYVRDGAVERKVSATNPQQSRYTWGTAELVNWKAYDGRMSQGILFRPEGFDPARTYPMICYFYERDSDSLFVYRPPSPVRSRIDISFFVSRGYVIFLPDIHYRTGDPGRSAYDYVVSGARAMVRKGGIDSTRIGIQGQSWGGYQAAHIITRTPLFAAAWAGAPVANMTSAYGGIRWESGVNRQFQYEKTQSRIGATLWEKRDLYIENSPLFHVPAIRTPLVIMSNDNDGAVPWYQGIEMFTAMRRLGKKVWLLNYNGEEHNLVQRKNKKDLSVREQQYFDWLLKGEKPPVWLTDGVPATEKGRTLGLN
jgi:dipeptidyl aminopeptidase/acylaminoacyl peptidase